MVKIKYFIFTLILVGSAPYASSQSHKMPEPGVMSAVAPPPPVGLPLPIDDHLPLLLLTGVLLGAFCVRRMKSA